MNALYKVEFGLYKLKVVNLKLEVVVEEEYNNRRVGYRIACESSFDHSFSMKKLFASPASWYRFLLNNVRR